MYPSFVYNYVFIYLFIYFYTGPTLIAVFITEMVILVKPKTNFMDNLGKSIVVSGRVFFSIIMRARARPLFLRTVFQILFRIPPPPPQKKKPKQRESKNRYFSVEILFGISCSVANPKYSGSSPNGHSRNRKALLSSTFTRRRSVFSNPIQTLYFYISLRGQSLLRTLQFAFRGCVCLRKLPQRGVFKNLNPDFAIEGSLSFSGRHERVSCIA